MNQYLSIYERVQFSWACKYPHKFVAIPSDEMIKLNTERMIPAFIKLCRRLLEKLITNYEKEEIWQRKEWLYAFWPWDTPIIFHPITLKLARAVYFRISFNPPVSWIDGLVNHNNILISNLYRTYHSLPRGINSWWCLKSSNPPYWRDANNLLPYPYFDKSKASNNLWVILPSLPYE